MKKKFYAALLLVGALVVAPIGHLTGVIASASSNNSVASANSTKAYEAQFINEVTYAESGSTVRMKDVQTLSSDFMKTLSEKNVTVVLEYTYKGVDYVVTIPAGGVIITPDVPYYGPLYLAQLYGNDLDKTQVETTAYTVKSGDTLNRIAAANGMTLNELLAANPQITNANRIRVGQVINVY